MNISAILTALVVVGVVGLILGIFLGLVCYRETTAEAAAIRGVRALRLQSQRGRLR